MAYMVKTIETHHLDIELSERVEVGYVLKENTPCIYPDSHTKVFEDAAGGVFAGQLKNGDWIAWSNYMETSYTHQDEPNIRAIAPSKELAAGALTEYYSNNELQEMVAESVENG